MDDVQEREAAGEDTADGKDRKRSKGLNTGWSLAYHNRSELTVGARGSHLLG